MGSRAKLADVPKLHELITNQVCPHIVVLNYAILTFLYRYAAS